MRIETDIVHPSTEGIIAQLLRCTVEENALIQRRLSSGVRSSVVVEEVRANRDLSKSLDRLVAELAPIDPMLSDGEYQKAMGQVRMGVDASFVAQRLRALCIRRQSITTTHVGDGPSA